MNITVNVVCRKDKANKNGTTPIHLRFTRGSKIRCVSTGTAIVPTAWDAQNRRIIIQNEEPQEIQYRIDSLLAEYHKRLKRLEILEADITLDNLLERNGRKNDGTTAEYFAQAITRQQEQGKINTATKYRFTLVSLQKVLPLLKFDELTLSHLHNPEQKLHETDCSANSTAAKISVLKVVYKRQNRQSAGPFPSISPILFPNRTVRIIILTLFISLLMTVRNSRLTGRFTIRRYSFRAVLSGGFARCVCWR